MPQAFSEFADFSGLAREPLSIRDVYHRVLVRVDERRTVGAAGSAVVMMPLRGGGPLPVVVDRPFVFAVRDRETNALLFLGRVADPRSS